MREGITITATEADAGSRADVFLSSATDMTRSHIAKLMKDGHVFCNGKTIKAKHSVCEGEQFRIEIPPLKDAGIEAESIPLDIVYQDEYLAVINKPRGMVVHPGPGNAGGTMVNALLHSLDNLSGINGELRPGIVHRLDKNTTGLIVVAKDDKTHLILSEGIKEKSIRREYLALVDGNLKEESGTVDAPIGRSQADRKRMAVVLDGRQARTHWSVEQRFSDCTLLRCRLETGRTHQIRVHMAYIKHPVIGDPEYGPRKDRAKAKGQLLHSERLVFSHPHTGELIDLRCDPPEDFLKVLRRLG